MITRIAIDGMACVQCVRAVFTSLAAVEGIVHAEVAIGGAVIEHDGRVTVEQLRDAIEVSGYLVAGGTEARRELVVISGSGLRDGGCG